MANLMSKMPYNRWGDPGLGESFWERGACVVSARRTAIRAAILTAAILVVPVRAWSAVMASDLGVYRFYPWWLQVMTMTVYSGQAYMALKGRESALLTALAVAVAGATAAVQGYADWRIGSWLWWSCMAAVQGFTYLQIRQADRELFP